MPSVNRFLPTKNPNFPIWNFFVPPPFFSFLISSHSPQIFQIELRYKELLIAGSAARRSGSYRSVMENEHGTKNIEHSKTGLIGGNDKHAESPLRVSGESEHTDLINESTSRLFEANYASSSNEYSTNPLVSMDNSSYYSEVFDGSYIHDYPKIRAVPSDDEADLFTPPSNSSVDLLKVDVNEDAKSTNEDTKPATPITSLPAHDKDSLSISEDVKSSTPKTSSPKSETSNNCLSSSSLTFQVPDVVRGQMEADISLTFSPPMQTMDRSRGYDPARIPSSVFESSTTTTPMEWSLCSNESLFSIHVDVGNTSFPTDHMFMFGDVGKTGDLTKSDELCILSSPQPVQETQTETKSLEKGKESAAEDIIDLNIKTGPIVNIKYGTSGSIKDAPNVNTEYANAQQNMLPPSTSNLKSSSMSCHSEGSATSTDSFAFPILTDAEKSGPLNPQHSQQLDVIATSNSTWRKWFSCFYCRPCNCNSYHFVNCCCFSCC